MIERWRAGLQGRALVVVDEAYVEFADAAVRGHAAGRAQPNIAVLRTLSKAHALAAARIGCVIADADADRGAAPLPGAVSGAGAVRRAGAGGAGAGGAGATARSASPQVVARARRACSRRWPRCAGVRRVYPSQANFLLVRFDRCRRRAFAALLAAGVVVRDMRAAPQLGDALRISIGTPEQNDARARRAATAGGRPHERRMRRSCSSTATAR